MSLNLMLNQSWDTPLSSKLLKFEMQLKMNDACHMFCGNWKRRKSDVFLTAYLI